LRKLAICILGPSGAGKGSFAARLGRYGFEVFSLSDVIRRVAKDAGIAGLGRADLQQFANDYRKSNGPASFARMLIEQLRREEKTRISIEGIRSEASLNLLRASLSEMGYIALAVGIETDERKRIDRILVRCRAGDPRNLVEARSADGEEFYRDIPEIVTLADIIVTNNGTLGEFERKVDCIVSEWLLSN
jgi:dephospho-CoA kinase